MQLGIDRPRAKFITIEGGKGNGKQVLAYPVWGEPKDPIPVAMKVFVNTDSGEKWIDDIKGPFDSLEQAESMAVESAADWYERGNG